jgi:DNA-binding MarR family transcriptional regulator
MSSGREPGSTVLLTRLARAVHRSTTEPVLGMRLKPYIVLDYLRDHGPATQQALGEALMLDPNNLVLLLNEIEGEGYARRERDPADRRRHIVELTEAGHEALERAEAGMESIEGEVLGRLSARDRAELHRLLSKALG